MNNENKPIGSKGHVSKLKRRHHQIHAVGSEREKLGTIHNAREVNGVGRKKDANEGECRKQSSRGLDDKLASNIAQQTTPGSKQNAPDSLSPSVLCNLPLPVDALSKFGFGSNLSRSDLLSVIPAIVGADTKRLATKEDVGELMNWSFAYHFKCRKKNVEGDVHPRNAFDNPIVGCVDLSKPCGCTENGGGEELSIAFPLSVSKKDDVKSHSLDALDFDGFITSKGNTGDRTRIPWSFCQFPNSRAVSTASLEKPDQSAMQQDAIEISKGNSTHQLPIAKECNQSKSIDQRGKHVQKTKYQGKIRIQTAIGASICKAYNIDTSQHVIGRLEYGDERYFFAKRVLPPPPISVDDSDDNECVAVYTRYKVLLEPGDVIADFVERDKKGRLTGWISDRSRLLNEEYSILREIECRLHDFM